MLHSLLACSPHVAGLVKAHGGSPIPAAVHFAGWTGGVSLSAKADVLKGRPAAVWIRFGDSDEMEDERRRPGKWMSYDDYNEISVFDVIKKAAKEALNFFAVVPPPPINTHKTEELKEKFRELVIQAEGEFLEKISGTTALLRYQWYTWESYGVTVKGYQGGTEQFLFECVRCACGKDGEIDPILLATFGIKEDNLPRNSLEKDLIGAILYTSKGTRDCVRKHELNVKARDERKRKLEEDDKLERSDDEHPNDDPYIGMGDI